MQRLAKYHSEETTLKALEVFSQACLNLTKGQHLDISFENKEAITINQYWQMINGKTASLLSTCALLGAVIAESHQARQQAFQQFGLHLGLAFQAQDDILGIWGDPKITGKSAASDLLTRKKSLPVIFGLEQKRAFASLWQQEINADNVELLANTLRQEGAYDYTKDQTAVMTEQAHEYFLKTGVEGDAAHALEELFDSLINRQS
jgi:geranylgeranyl diphosphate synthase type I